MITKTFCCTALSRLAVKIRKKIVAAVILLPLFSFSQTHEYLFNGNFNETSGGPAITELLTCGATAGSYGTQSTNIGGNCLAFNAFCFENGGGMQYPNASVIGSSYTINMFFKFNSAVGWGRVIDFSNRTWDGGLYIDGTNTLYFYPYTGVGIPGYFNANTFYWLTVVRNGATNLITVYVNGALFGTYSDPAGNFRPPTSLTPINFFIDDQCETRSGCIAYLSVSPTVATAANVTATYANIVTLIQASIYTPPGISITPASPSLTCTTVSVPLTVAGGASYTWSNGVTTAINTVNTPNTYSVTITDANGCTATAASIVSQNITAPTASISPTTYTLNCTNTTTFITASGGTSYNWGGGITTPVNFITLPNTYNVTVTGANGCTATASAVVSQNITPPAAAISPAAFTLNCSSPSTTLTASGGGTYNWGGGITTATNLVNAVNTYNVTVTGANGCTATASSVVSQNITPPVASVNPASATLTCSTPSTTLTAGGGGTYNWGGGITTAANTVNAANTYTVTVTAANGCTATASSVISQNIAAPTASVSPASATLTCAIPSTTLTASGGGTYNWGGGITTAANTVNAANTYTVTVTAANGCTATASATVSQNFTPPVVGINPASFTLTCTTPSTTLTASGGGTYNWGGGITTATNSVNSPNTYTVTVTDANGCSASASSVISQNITPPVASVSPASATLTCATTTATLTAGGVGTYNWGGGITTATNSVSTANTYTVTVTAANGCTATASSVVSQNITPPGASVSPASATLTCASPSATLTAGGGSLYNWGGGITTATNTVNSPNIYTVTATGANGCTATASATITQSNTPPVVSISPASASLTCIAPSVTLTANGAGTYNWGGGITTATNTVNTANTYSVTVTDVNGCTASASAVVSQNTTPPVAAINSGSTALTCATASIVLTATGGGTYDWGGGLTTTTNTVSTPNTYGVTVTGANGCTATASSVITQNITPPVASVSPATASLTCTSASAILTASGGGTYNWGGGIITAANTVNIANTYTVTVTAANGCTATASSVVSQNITPPVASVSPATATLTCASPSATLTAGGGSSYNWGGGITTATNTVNSPSTYTVTVTDANGCTATASATITQSNTPPVVSISPASASLTCIAPSVTLTANGAGTYNWGGGITTATNTVNTANTYSVTVTDVNGCTASASAVVSQNTTPPVAAINSGSTALTCATASIVLTATGGGTYDWGGGLTTTTNTVSTPNTYGVTVTGANGCTATTSSVITQNITPPVAGISPASATLTCTTPSATLTASGGGTYDWGGGITTTTNTVNSPNTYNVTVTAANGCTATASSVISQSITVPPATISPVAITLDCITPSTTLTASGGTSYNWGGGITTTTNTVNTASTYTVTVTDVNGCTATASSVVSQNITPPVVAVSPANASLNCVTASVVLTASGGGTYDWGGGITTTTTTVNSANTYTVTVTGANGCTATSSSIVIQDFTPPATTMSPASGTLTCTTASIALVAGGGVSYDWGGGIITATNTINTANTYTVTATGANGCTATASSVITQNITPPVAGVTPASAILTCATASVTLTASGGATYDWGGGITTVTNTVVSPNTYTVTAIGNNGCTATASSVVSQDIATPNASIAPAATLTCVLLNTTLTASSTTANASFNWGGGITTATKTVSLPGAYTVTVTDPLNGCTVSSSVNVTQTISTPNISLTNTGILSCVNANVTINASSTTPNVTYDWGAGNTTTSNTVTIAGNYTITVTDPANSCTATTSNTVQQNTTPPAVNIAPSASLNCVNASVTLTASSPVTGATYDWGGGITTATNTVSSPATYPVTVTDPGNGCSASVSVNVIQNLTIPNVSIAPPVVITCHTPSISLSASSTALIPSYNWGGGNTASTLSVSVANTYSVTVTDIDNGCSGSATATVTDVPLMNLSETHTNVSCFSFSDGAIDLTVAGGQQPLSFVWSNSNINEDITGVAAGNYSVVVTDNINCTTTISVTLTEPASMLVSETHTNVTCNGVNDGSINVTVSAGTPVYVFRWNDNDLNEDRNALAPGNYSVTVTDNNSCSVSTTAVITEPVAVNVQPVVNQPTCASNGNDGSISVTATGGTTPFAFAWSNGVTADNISQAGVGNYSLTVTDANGCFVTSAFQLAYIYDFVVDASPFATIDMGDNTLLTYTLTGNTGNYTSKWAPCYGLGCLDCTSTEASPVYSTLYNVTIENEVGCYASDTVTVRVLPKYEVFVPNAFTPNNDGINDLFEVYGKIRGVEYLEMQIFNRLGEKVFETSDHQFTWDGTYKGEKLAPQILTWQMRITWMDGHRDELRKGTITMLK